MKAMPAALLIPLSLIAVLAAFPEANYAARAIPTINRVNPSPGLFGRTR
jgi:hypothetical protein